MNNRQSSEIALRPATLAFWTAKSLVFQFILVASSVALPAAAHLAGAPVRFLLPMHWPVLLAGLAYGWRGGALVGLAAPIASYAVSGYPLPPILPAMTIELFVYGLFAGLLRERLHLNGFISVAVAVVIGRLAFMTAAVMTGGVLLNAEYLKAALLPGLPAAAVQIALLPVLAGWWVKRAN